MFAGHVIVPVHERTLRVVAPGPDVQFEKRIQVETVGGSNELKVLSFKYRRSIIVILQPGGCVHNVLDANQSALLPHRFVDQGFRMRDINLPISHQAAVDVVNAHRAMIRTADTAKRGSVPGWPGIVYIQKRPGCLPDFLHQLRWGVVAFMVRLLGHQRCDGNHAA